LAATDAVADLTGALDAAHIPANFLNNETEQGKINLELLEKAAQGNEDAIRDLGIALAES
jgi:hypothetical protein